MIKEILHENETQEQNEAWSEKMFGVSKEGYEAMTKGKDKKALGMLAMSILSDAQEKITDRKTEQLLNVVKYIIDSELR